MKRAFVMTAGFEHLWARMGLGDEELQQLQDVLLSNPDAGDVIQGLSGARKVRIPLPDRGKSGGGRVIYVDVVVRKQIHLLMAYPKNAQTDLNQAQRKILRHLIDQIKEE